MLARITTLDRFRGFALFGILMVNIPFMGLPEDASVRIFEAGTPLWDKVASAIMVAVFEGKFFPIFSFLFGYGFALQLQGKTGENNQIFFRRLSFLFVIGIIHYLFLFHGDILVTYSLLGGIFFLLRNKSDRFFFKLGFATVFLSGFCYYVIGNMMIVPIPEESLKSAQEAVLNSLWEGVQHRIDSAPFLFGFGILFNWPSTLGMLGIGFVFGRKNYLARGNLSAFFPKKFFQRIVWICFLASVFVVFCFAYSPKWVPIGMLVLGWTAPLQSLVYLNLFDKFRQQTNLTWTFVESLGQNSLTIYLSESLCMAFVFHSWGLGLYGQIGMAGVMGIGVLIYLGLGFLGYFLVKIWGQGPMERLLRWYAYP